jgi:2-amino-4-hydroxy-6-hydroxymethyldihydropteridine diphosphokinase
MIYYLNIGSNIGDRRDNLYRAVVAIEAGTTACVVSSIVESEPWGFESENRFLNIGVCIESTMTPHGMLRHLQAIERRLGSASHRDEHGNYADRLVDIDIVAIEGKVINTRTLQVPHPHLAERDFFLRPMMELAPDWRHPVTGLTAAQMLEKLNQ